MAHVHRLLLERFVSVRLSYRSSRIRTLNPKPSSASRTAGDTSYQACDATRGFPKMGGGYPFGGPYNKDYSTLGSILGPLILGNYHNATTEHLSL